MKMINGEQVVRDLDAEETDEIICAYCGNRLYEAYNYKCKCRDARAARGMQKKPKGKSLGKVAGICPTCGMMQAETDVVCPRCGEMGVS